ncbi:phosphatidylinositol 3-kinase [Geosmithia morbida]|uniref:Phosphatidylinositol 3-kinase VPS34 n=1 Tax=Geosmithia morbida TaxID=1094350 RepID=A0A9P5D397_9HYPO|nr:phosphatidylinositol 3-kinase [Geosmithia morbida]KAF4124697.1 phosphatidylinositol 3-kinase [Geosmithia morbida]
MNLEGDEPPLKYSTLLSRPDLRHVGSNTGPSSDLFVTVQVWAGSKPLTVPVQTAYRPFRSERRWNEWLQLPITYQALPADACLAVTIWDLSPTGGEDAVGHAIPFGGTTLPMFDQENQVQRGRQKCLVHRRKRADGMGVTTTPALVPACRRSHDGGSAGKGGRAAAPLDRDAEELDRMERLFKKHELGEIPRVDWLDQMVFRDFERRGLQAAKSSMTMMQRQRALDGAGTAGGADEAGDSAPAATTFLLNVELPRFDLPLVFADHEYPAPPISTLQNLTGSQPGMAAQRQQQSQQPQVQFGPGINGVEDGTEGLGNRLIKVYDPDAGMRDNPAEAKHRRLFRSSHRHGILDKDLKPNAKVRDELNQILSCSPTHVLTPEESDLVWKFRYHLTRDKRALTKFVKSVNWADASESKQATQVIGRWTEIDVDDALELLGPSFDNASVRSYAVDRLRKSEDDELLLYLLQLVQALKYERVPADPERDVAQDSSLARFLIQRAAANFLLGNYFYWYLMVECDDHDHAPAPATAHLHGAGDDQPRDIFRKVAYEFVVELERRPGGAQDRRMLLRQAEMFAVLSRIANQVKASSESMAKKAERVKHFIADPANELLSFEPPLAMPLDPSVSVTGMVPDQITVFKSTLNPIKFTFKTTTGTAYPVIFKLGDDMRQDQLVIQIITLMDQLLQKENLDLRLTPYKILATSTSAGALQFVQSQSLSSIVSTHKANPALAYLRRHNPDDDNQAAGGVRQEALDTYVRSCAGYCVITYILGVGDRHLENLLLAPDGHFFHADFGFILGRDPKPFAPVMKLSKEMVDCMGGVQSEHYAQFRQYCFLAYTALRKSSNLILNLFSLMVDANIPDIRLEPDKAVLKVRERFHLELSEEDAILYFGRVIDDTLSAYAPVVLDKLHEWAQAFRA